MSDYSIGDIVRLKSGGPAMTVIDPEGYNDLVETTWFSGSKKEEGRFPEAALDRVQLEQKK